MTDFADTAHSVHGARPIGPYLGALTLKLRLALQAEAEHRRFFLWLPVAFGAGVSLYFVADREPWLPLVSLLCLGFSIAALMARAHRRAFLCLVGAAAVSGGMASAAWHSTWVAAPVLDRIRIAEVQGWVEEVDPRQAGARFVLRLAAADTLESERMPVRVRLSTRREPDFQAGDYVQMKTRLLPPSRAAEPGGYDFARDAWFSGIGAVGSVLGRVEKAEAPEPASLSLRAFAAIDRARNALAQRVDAIVGGDAGAIAAAMVTGKRDLLSDQAKDLIREAGIFHVITISGVQMTLVAGIFYVGLRRLLALSTTLALRYPIKKWAAATAIAASVAYDLMTGSRIGTERALFMTTIMLSAVILDRQALTMRNLALAALLVLLVQPDALLGASFQLSFAAVGALVAVYEARASNALKKAVGVVVMPVAPHRGARRGWFGHGGGLKETLIATACATVATASFMAYDFHEVNPYVIVGNPLTLAIIELFAVPGALLGTLLYPLGLDAFVWHWVGFGISIIMAAARVIGSMPGASLHLPAFASWSLPFFALAVLSVIIWRSTLLRLTALPFAVIGLLGAISGPSFDIAVPATGDAAAVRGRDGRLTIIGARPSLFAAEQWLRADADARGAKNALANGACDKEGCVAALADGRSVSVVLEPSAFAEDCVRAAVIVTPLFAPTGCAAPVVLDRDALRENGATTLRAVPGGFLLRTAREKGEDRPWSPVPRRQWTYRLPNTPLDLDEETQ